jgi:hypothetical protein
MTPLSQEEIRILAEVYRIEVLTSWIKASAMSYRNDELVLSFRDTEIILHVKAWVKRSKKNHRIENWDLPAEGEYYFHFDLKEDVHIIDTRTHKEMFVEKGMFQEIINFLNQ